MPFHGPFNARPLRYGIHAFATRATGVKSCHNGIDAGKQTLRDRLHPPVTVLHTLHSPDLDLRPAPSQAPLRFSPSSQRFAAPPDQGTEGTTVTS